MGHPVCILPQVTLPCVVTNMKGSLQWTRDGFGLGLLHDLPGYPRYSMVGDAEAGEYNLEVRDIALEDDAVFQCQVSAMGGVPAIRSNIAQVSSHICPDFCCLP